MPVGQIHKTQPESRKSSDSNTKAILTGLQLGFIKVDAENAKIYNSKGIELKQVSNFFGYPQVQAYIAGKNTKIYVHKAVWVSVYGAVPPNMEIDHIDNNNENAKINNLQLLHWYTNLQKVTTSRKPQHEAL